MTGRWFITPHAVQRYRQRVRECSYEEALAVLVDWSERAHYVKQRNDGAELWRGPKPLRLRLVVGKREDGAPQLVTVLGGMVQRRYREGIG